MANMKWPVGIWPGDGDENSFSHCKLHEQGCAHDTRSCRNRGIERSDVSPLGYANTSNFGGKVENLRESSLQGGGRRHHSARSRPGTGPTPGKQAGGCSICCCCEHKSILP